MANTILAPRQAFVRGVATKLAHNGQLLFPSETHFKFACAYADENWGFDGARQCTTDDVQQLGELLYAGNQAQLQDLQSRGKTANAQQAYIPQTVGEVCRDVVITAMHLSGIKLAGEVARSMELSTPQVGELTSPMSIMEDELQRRPAGYSDSPVGGSGLSHVPDSARQSTHIPTPGATGPAAQGPTNTLEQATKSANYADFFLRKLGGDVVRSMDVASPQIDNLSSPMTIMEDEKRRRPAGYTDSPVGGSGLGHVPAAARQSVHIPTPGVTGPAAQGPTNTLEQATKSASYLGRLVR